MPFKKKKASLHLPFCYFWFLSLKLSQSGLPYSQLKNMKKLSNFFVSHKIIIIISKAFYPSFLFSDKWIHCVVGGGILIPRRLLEFFSQVLHSMCQEKEKKV